MIKQVFLLYECDQFLSIDSQVLMGVFTSDEELRIASDKLIHEKIDTNYDEEGYDDGEGWSKEEMKEYFAQQILKKLIEDRQTQTYTINYIIKEVEVNKLGEI